MIDLGTEDFTDLPERDGCADDRLTFDEAYDCWTHRRSWLIPRPTITDRPSRTFGTLADLIDADDFNTPDASRSVATTGTSNPVNDLAKIIMTINPIFERLASQIASTSTRIEKLVRESRVTSSLTPDSVKFMTTWPAWNDDAPGWSTRSSGFIQQVQRVSYPPVGIRPTPDDVTIPTNAAVAKELTERDAVTADAVAKAFDLHTGIDA